MIIGTGIDITDISRIDRLIKETDFLNRFFSDKEREYFKKKGNKANSVAGAFAAKEAFSKAMGTGISNFSLKDIEVLHNDKGMPYINLKNNADELSRSRGAKKIFVSISHDGGFAIASVTLEGDDIF